MNENPAPDQTPATSSQVAAADQTPAVPILSPALEQLLAADPMLTIEEVAAYLRVPVKTVGDPSDYGMSWACEPPGSGDLAAIRRSGPPSGQAGAANQTGHRDVEVAVRVIGTASEAQCSPFSGSPTIVVDGVDLFASSDIVEDLPCRVYHTTFGVAGYPTADQIIERLVGA